MGIPFPSTEVIRNVFSYDEISASFSAFEAARIDRVMHPEGSKWNWTLAIVALLGSSLALWRVWTFTVRPWMYPDEAKEIPYWVPCKIRMSCAFAKAERSSRSRYSVPGPDIQGDKAV